MRRQQAVILTIVMGMFFSTTTLAIDGNMGLTTEPLTDGSEAYPYLIEDFDDFQIFANSANSAIYWARGVHTRLDCNLDLDPNISGRQTYATAVIAPIDPYVDAFEGVFDGNDHTISNLTINTEGAGNDYLALFGYVADPNTEDPSTEIRNLGIVDCSITGGGSTSTRLGGLCGVNAESSIDNCYATGVIKDGAYIGGLCGQNSSSGGYASIPASISNSYAHVAVTGTTNLGGLCGFSGYSNITNCYATGNVYGSGMYGNNGGLCGTNNGGVVSFCFAFASGPLSYQCRRN